MKDYIKENKKIFITILIFYVISVLAISSFSIFLSKSYGNLTLKQSINYVIGLLLMFILYKIGIKKILKYSFFIYLFNVVLLVLVLFFAPTINGIKAWFTIPFIGNFQPSEFMKIGIVLFSAKIIDNTKLINFKDELLLILKLFIIVLIPSVLTFLEPDTGAVIIYFIIFVTLLFISGIRIRWFVFIGLAVSIVFGGILYLFFYQSDLFIKLVGNSFFYRLDRLFDWKASSGMQLTNSIIAIASSGVFGHGYKNIPIYYPEGHTDFIFTSFGSSFGLIGISILGLSIIYFDFLLFKEAVNSKKDLYRNIVIGFLIVFIYQQIQNIAMTVGILPITGITLPMISYGGSSLLSFFIIIGVILAIKKDLN